MANQQLDIYDVLTDEQRPPSGDKDRASVLCQMADRMTDEVRRAEHALARAKAHYLAHRELEWEAARLRELQALTRAIGSGFADGSLPPYLQGVKTKDDAKLVARLGARHNSTADGWAWRWEFFQRTGWLQHIGISTEEAFNSARTWVVDVLARTEGKV